MVLRVGKEGTPLHKVGLKTPEKLCIIGSLQHQTFEIRILFTDVILYLKGFYLYAKCFPTSSDSKYSCGIWWDPPWP